MGLVHRFIGEERLIGRNQRQIMLVGQLQEGLLEPVFAIDVVALDFDVKTPRKQPGQLQKSCLGRVGLSFPQQPTRTPCNPTRKRNQAVRRTGQVLDLHHGPAVISHFHERPADDP